MLDKYPIDFPRTYNGAILQAVEPKMDPQSPMEQAKDKNGVMKWLVYLNLEAKSEAKSVAKKKFENITVTITSPNKPYGAIPLNSAVTIENLQLGTMPREKGGYNLYFTCEAIRPAQPVRVASGQ